MSAPPAPAFASLRDYVSRLEDTGFWWPYAAEVLARHGLLDVDARPGPDPVSGVGGTYPTFLYGDVVVKLFGGTGAWRESHTAERAALALVATDPEIAAPRLLGEGRLYDGADASWPYLISTRIHGDAGERAELSAAQQLSLAAELGRGVRRVHALPPAGIATDADWPVLDIADAARRSSLPPHLAARAADYVTRLRPFDRVFVHGDLTLRHTFVEDGRLTGIIDWGDATVTDRHYELCQVHRAVFHCDKALLRAFLDASDWPAGKGFARQALGLALYRQAVGLVQHHSMDVFEPVARVLPLDDIGTLDELATALFDV
ncbi:phosphotransferase family protein [Streptomyces scopuliridis]|uniref:phosphotransferase family protein n=1 Tax=Streptomyces scopuliridis TaxID=452529 RepID=UPI0036845EC4